MDRSTRRVFLAILGLLIVGGLAIMVRGGDEAPSRPDGPTLDGVVIGVTSAALTSVSGFTLRTDDGRTHELGLEKLRNGTAYPPSHLAEHLAMSQRIRVWYSGAGGGRLDALWLEDLPSR